MLPLTLLKYAEFSEEKPSPVMMAEGFDPLLGSKFLGPVG